MDNGVEITVDNSASEDTEEDKTARAIFVLLPEVRRVKRAVREVERQFTALAKRYGVVSK